MTDSSGPIQFHFLCHPGSELAKVVARGLFERFVDPPLSGGLRVPVFFTPEREDGLPPDPAHLVPGSTDRSIVVVLSDAVMMRRVDGGTGPQWTAFLQEMVKQAAELPDQMAVLPVALDSAGFDLADTRNIINASLVDDLEENIARQRQIAEVSFHIATLGLRLLRNETVGAAPITDWKAPVTLFLSHAKRDVSKDQSDPVYQTLHALADLPVEHWFDAADIEASEVFSEAIETGIRESTIIVAFHTDHFDSRPWCRREILAAKRHGANLLVVSALSDAVPRQFPYLGNVPVVRWWNKDPSTDARRVIDRAVLEAFRLVHNRVVLEALAEPDDIVLPSAPEAITLAVTPEGSPGQMRTFFYADPPLDKEELSVLTSLRPQDRFETPLSRQLQRMSELRGLPVAVSISSPGNLEKRGMSEMHLRTLTDEIHLHFLLGGLAIIYGGALNADPSDPENFVLRLFELARGYSPLATDLQTDIQPILNIPPWPLHVAYGDKELGLFGKIADLERGPEPDLPWSLDELFPPEVEGWRFTPRSAEQRYAWARGLDATRHRIAERAAAHVIIGGKLDGFAGIVPGVLEEAYVALGSGKPLYLIGAFGGVGEAVINQMFGGGNALFGEESAQVVDREEVDTLFERHGGTPHDTSAMGAVFAQRGRDGPQASLNNGLTDAENTKLFWTTDARQIVELVLTGLARTVG